MRLARHCVLDWLHVYMTTVIDILLHPKAENEQTCKSPHGIEFSQRSIFLVDVEFLFCRLTGEHFRSLLSSKPVIYSTDVKSLCDSLHCDGTRHLYIAR